LDQIDQRSLEETPAKSGSFFRIAERLPGGGQTKIVVGVVVPVVVDLETVGIEPADIHAVTVRVERLSASIYVTEARGLPLQKAYILLLLNFIWEQPLMASP